MANFTTENNNAYCFRIGPAFLDTSTFSNVSAVYSGKLLVLVQ